jgi:ABC-type dipeptide/oligopeptide/nickel transport system permease component
VTVVFFALRVLPGDAIETQLLQSGASPTVIEERREEAGLNDPLWLQYAHYMTNLIQGNLGYSFISGQEVGQMIGTRLAATATLALAAMALAVTMGIAAGLYTALNPLSKISTLSDFGIILALSVPISWSGTLALLLFAVTLKWLPSSGSDGLDRLFLPTAVLGFHVAGSIAFVVRARIREIIASDFVRTAKAKGLPRTTILLRHILPVALSPIITVVFLQFGFLLSGTVITESLFVRTGIGKLLLDSTLQHDFPVVQGIAVFIVIIYATLNMVTDLLLRLLDPRVLLA